MIEKTKNTLPRTWGNLPKRTNKRNAPLKHQMVFWLRDFRNINLSLNDCPLKHVKKVFVEQGGNKWWESNTKDHIKG